MRLDFSSRCPSEHQTLIEARLPEGNCGRGRRVRGLETHWGPRTVPIMEMDELREGAVQLEPGSGEGRHGSYRRRERAENGSACPGIQSRRVVPDQASQRLGAERSRPQNSASLVGFGP